MGVILDIGEIDNSCRLEVERRIFVGMALSLSSSKKMQVNIRIPKAPPMMGPAPFLYSFNPLATEFVSAFTLCLAHPKDDFRYTSEPHVFLCH